MSFRQNARYGYVPPAQYGNQQDAGLGLQRRTSFDNGDDASMTNNASRGQQMPQSPGYQRGPSSPNEPIIGGAPQPPPRPSYIPQSPALSGYQHQYQPNSTASQAAPPTPSSYNPQQFARTYSTNTQNTYQQPSYNNPQPYGHQSYNPAAYSPQAAPQRQQTMPSYGNSGYGQLPPQPPPATPYYNQPGQYAAQLPQRTQSQQIFTPPSQQLPFVPAASAPPLPSRPAAYGSPAHSMPYPTNGSNFTTSDYRSQPYSTVQMPSAPMSSSLDTPSEDSYSDRVSRSSSQSNATFVTPSLASESSGIRRHPTLRPLPSAPLNESRVEWTGGKSAEEEAQEQIYQDIEAAIMNTSSQNKSNGDLLDSELGDLHRFDSRATTANQSTIGRSSSTASGLVHTPSDIPYDDDYEEEDSDAEAAAGVMAMRLAEQQDALRGNESFGIYDGQQSGSQEYQKPAEDISSDSDYANIDMGLYGGGYDAHMSYGDDMVPADASHYSEMDDQSRPLPTPGELHRSDGYEPAPGLGGMTNYGIPNESDLHPFPAFDAARVDNFGTGGLQRPFSQNHRLSFDEGDESIGSRYAESRLSGHSGSESPIRDDIPDMFYHPGMSASQAQRPLPPVPSLAENRTPQLLPAGSYRNSTYSQNDSSSDTSRYIYPPDGPDAYQQDLLSPNAPFVPRSASLTSHSSTPQVIPPTRSRTDAEERQARQRALRQQGLGGSAYDGFEAATPQSTVALDLPALPLGRRRKISPGNLRSADFKRCQEPWALSRVAEWTKEMCGGETGDGESDLREKAITECLVALFTHKVPTMNTADAEVLSNRLVNDMFTTGVLMRDEEWVKFGQGTMSGVLWQMTGSGCYAPKLHELEIKGRCYSHHCGRTLKKLNLQLEELEPAKKTADWHVFFKLTKEQIDATDRKEIQRQNALHEIVMSEDKYMDRLNVLRVLYRDQLQSWQPPIIASNKIERFITQVFGKVEAIKIANQEHLLAQLKYRQQEQGPFVQGFSDIFREWVRKARSVYMEYAAGYSQASYMVKREAQKNILFRQFLDQARENPMSDRLDWHTFLFAPLKRLQQYTLMLREVLKSSIQDTEEKANLLIAIEEINNVTLECDAKVDEMAKKVELIELSHKLFLRPGMERAELNLDHLGRELIFKGDLVRAGSNRFTWLDTHAILFDHYLVLAKTVPSRDGPDGKSKEIYDVSKLPIPMQLLVLENTTEEPVVKAAKVLAVTTVARPATADSRTTRTSTASDRPLIEHTNTNTSLSSNGTLSKTVTATNLENDAKAMFPFRVKHLGRTEVYTLYAPTSQNRKEWCDKIREAKQRYATSLFAQNAEPFRLKIMADSAFAYDAMTAASKSGGELDKGTPLDRAIRDMEREYGHARPGPVCRATVNCATSFVAYGQSMVAIGTDYGVYTADASNPRGWIRSIQMNRVTQIQIIEDFSLCLVIADKSLIAYHLDVIVPPSSGGAYPAPPVDNSSARRAPQKLSGAREVAFFATARMKDRTLVFYKKREGLNSVFKVIEPVFQKSSEKKSKLFGRAKPYHSGSNTEFFREFDDFYIPAECFTINLFHTYIAISTARGFELLTLDKKFPTSIPDLKQPAIATIAARLSGQKPLGMFRLSDAEFLLCYEECGVYISKHGEVSRSVVLEFVGKASSAALFGAYLLLFDSDFVEVRNAENGRLRQIIAGRDVRCLDYGVPGVGSNSAARNLKIAMAHPEIAGSQLVMELILNSGQRE